MQILFSFSSSLCRGHFVNKTSFDLCGLRVTCHFRHHASTLSTSPCSVIAASHTLEFKVHNPTSSAYWEERARDWSSPSVRSFTKIKYSMGEMQDPWGCLLSIRQLLTRSPHWSLSMFDNQGKKRECFSAVLINLFCLFCASGRSSRLHQTLPWHRGINRECSFAFWNC